MNDMQTIKPITAAESLMPPQASRNRCAHCGRPFGLVRHRLGTKQLCSKPCADAEGERMQRALKEKVRRLAGRG